MQDDSKKCAHFACGCLTESGEDYCSEACRNAGWEDDPRTHGTPCSCGHAGCAAGAARAQAGIDAADDISRKGSAR
jgi:hypothetical protein